MLYVACVDDFAHCHFRDQLRFAPLSKNAGVKKKVSIQKGSRVTITSPQ
jgi:hypothetical protein